MDVTLLCPTPDYVLDERYGLEPRAEHRPRAAARSAVSHDIESAYAGADVVYAKAGAPCRTWRQGGEADPRCYKHFIVDEAKIP